MEHVNGKRRISMKIGIMQPYFSPYLGYWQLMNEVNIYDDAYIKHGWINRNAGIPETKYPRKWLLWGSAEDNTSIR